MIRRAFTMRLKPGCMVEYKLHHDSIPTRWKKLAEAINASGIATITTFERDPDLFLYSEIYDQGAWDRLWNTDIHKEWGLTMEQLMNFKDGKVDFGELREIFHFASPPRVKAKKRTVPSKKAKTKAKTKTKIKSKRK